MFEKSKTEQHRQHLRNNLRFLKKEYYKEKDKGAHWDADVRPVRTDSILQLRNPWTGQWEDVDFDREKHYVL